MPAPTGTAAARATARAAGRVGGRGGSNVCGLCRQALCAEGLCRAGLCREVRTAKSTQRGIRSLQRPSRVVVPVVVQGVGSGGGRHTCWQHSQCSCSRASCTQHDAQCPAPTRPAASFERCIARNSRHVGLRRRQQSRGAAASVPHASKKSIQAGIHAGAQGATSAGSSFFQSHTCHSASVSAPEALPRAACRTGARWLQGCCALLRTAQTDCP